MTHKEEMAALVQQLNQSAYMKKRGDDLDGSLARTVCGRKALNARPSIALALEIVEAARQCRELNTPEHVATVDHLNLSEKIADAENRWSRLDALLKRWESANG